MQSFPERPHHRPLLLGDGLDEKLQLYIRILREGGGVVSSKIVMAAACGTILPYDRSKLAENGDMFIKIVTGHIYFETNEFVQRKATTSKSKYSNANFAEAKKLFLTSVVQIVTMEEIPPGLVLNWDETGIMIVPSTSWTVDKRGTKRVEITSLKVKRQITAMFCGTVQGDCLPVQIIYKGTTQRCHPCFKFPPGWLVTHSKNHWSTEQTMVMTITLHLLIILMAGSLIIIFKCIWPDAISRSYIKLSEPLFVIFHLFIS